MATRDDLDALKAQLAERGPDLAVALFGTPTKRTTREWRWGRKGSLRIGWRGRSGPTFYSFEATQGGSLLDAIAHANDCSFAQALRWARDWLGGAVETPTPTPRPKAKARPTYDADADMAERIAAARDLWRAGRPARPTDAAGRYLVGRAIEGWPLDSVRFLPAGVAGRDPVFKGWRWCAAMFPATDDAGDVCAVQLVALHDDGRRVLDSDGKKRHKPTRGARPGATVRFPARPDAMADALLICEGPETALSVWLATGCETRATLGGWLSSLRGVPVSRAVVICRDDDPRKVKRKDGTEAPNPAVAAVRTAVAALRAEGRAVVEALPWRYSRDDKSDFNDVLKADGVEAVRARIAAALAPRPDGPGRDATSAGGALAREIGRAATDLAAWRETGDGEAPPFAVVKASLGLGKTTRAIDACLDLVEAGHKVVMMGPTHRLMSELAQRIAETGRPATFAVWQGREQIDPASDDGAAMCLDLEAVEAAHAARVNADETICTACQHRKACGYQAQRAKHPDIWLAASALRWVPRPAGMRGATLAILDEGFALGGFRPAIKVSLDDLDAMPTHGRKGDEATADLLAELRPTLAKLRGVLAAHPLGEPDKHGEAVAAVEADRMAAAGLSADDADRARSLALSCHRTIDPKRYPTRDDRVKALRAIGSGNAWCNRVAALCGEVAALLRMGPGARSGRVEAFASDGPDGETRRGVRIFGLSPQGRGWNMPTLNLDATADLALICRRVPHAELRAVVEAAAPNMRVRQYVGRAFGARSLSRPGSTLQAAWRWAVAKATHAGGRWLLIGNKAVVEAIRGAYTVPDFVTLAHFNAVAGRDEWQFPGGETCKGGDLRGVIILGRPMPPPAGVERIAGVLTGRAVECAIPAKGWYPVEAVTLRGADGSVRTVEADRHPDALAESVRAAICDAEILQAIGRGRGVRRSLASPLDVLICGNVPLPVPVETVADWQPPTFDETLLADHGAVPSSQGDAAKLAGMAPPAVKMARQRDRARGGRLVTAPIEQSSIAAVTNLCRVAYQIAGPGRQRATLVFDSRRIPDVAGWLAAKLGPVAYVGPVEAQADADLTKPDLAATGDAPAIGPGLAMLGNVGAGAALAKVRDGEACGLSKLDGDRRCGSPLLRNIEVRDLGARLSGGDKYAPARVAASKG